MPSTTLCTRAARRALASALLAAAAASHLRAQAARQDFTHALERSKQIREAGGMLPGEAHWIDDTSIFWYEETDGTRHSYLTYDAQTKSRSALDKQKIAAALVKDRKAEEPLKPEEARLDRLRFEDRGRQISFVFSGARWTCTLPAYDCKRGEQDDEDGGKAPGFEGNDPQRAVPSPDGKWEATIRNYNVFLHAVGSKEQAVALSTEGTAGDYYQRSSLEWSPDGKHLLARRVLQGMRREVHYVESSPEDQLQPKASSRFYAKPGDVLDREQPVLFDPAARKQTVIATDLFPNAFELSAFAWRKDSSAFTFVYNQRGHQRLDVLSVDASTAEVRRVIDETSKTFIDYSELNPEPTEAGKFYRRDMSDGAEILWLSERDGWAHLYLYDGRTGAVKNQVTRGPWVVRGVEHVDEAKREIYFEASGVDPKLDPYFTQLYRIGFDGTGMKLVTTQPADHQVSFSSNGAFYVDRWSRVDLAPELDLRRTADNSAEATIEKADLGAIRAAGWMPPEPFVAKGRDGRTDILGLIWKPAGFDPSRRYPVVESIYAGPQGSFVPKSFTPRVDPLTQMGFVVVQIDGMGTNNRSRAFHDVAWKNLKDAGFEDRVLWHKAAAAKYPWYDAGRVGIFGTSAGGQSAMGALLFHGDFYKAAVANSGCHDNRMDKIWWNEQWMGWPVGPEYAASSNVVNAARLQGRLMLVMGEMDSNVDPSSTLQVVNALIKANKDFEFLDVPGGGHGAGGEYAERRLLDFFMRSLKNENTANWNAAPSPQAGK